ncbi:BRO-N domain-containing protein [Vibrio metschnikovii]
MAYATQIGTALGYAREDSVSRIYDRNRDEFSSGMSMTVNLTVNGINNSLRQKSVRIFSLRGAHLIAMFARTAIAKQFRRWVLDILDRKPKHKLSSPSLILFKFPKPIGRSLTKLTGSQQPSL